MKIKSIRAIMEEPRIKEAIDNKYSDEEIMEIIYEEINKLKKESFKEARKTGNYDDILEFIAPHILPEHRRKMYSSDDSIYIKFTEVMMEKYVPMIYDNIYNAKIPKEVKREINKNITHVFRNLKESKEIFNDESCTQNFIENIVKQYDLSENKEDTNAIRRYIKNLINEKAKQLDCRED